MQDSQEDIIREGRQDKLINEYMESLGPQLSMLVKGHKNAEILINEVSQWIEDNKAEYEALMERTYYPLENISVRVTKDNQVLMRQQARLLVGLQSAMTLGYYLGQVNSRD